MQLQQQGQQPLVQPCLQVWTGPPQASRHYQCPPLCVQTLPCNGAVGHCVSSRPAWILPLRLLVMTPPCRDGTGWAHVKLGQAGAAKQSKSENRCTRQALTWPNAVALRVPSLRAPEATSTLIRLSNLRQVLLMPAAAWRRSLAALRSRCLACTTGCSAQTTPRRRGSLLGAVRPACRTLFLAWSSNHHEALEMKLSGPYNSHVA